jgi:hypothetical protein
LVGREIFFRGARVWWPSAKTPQLPDKEKRPEFANDDLEIHAAAAREPRRGPAERESERQD